MPACARSVRTQLRLAAACGLAPMSMTDRVEIPLSELPRGTVKFVELDGERICIAHTNEGVYAVSDTCTHARAQLSDGHLEGRQVVCPWHGAMFDLATGRATCGPAVDPLRC